MSDGAGSEVWNGVVVHGAKWAGGGGLEAGGRDPCVAPGLEKRVDDGVGRGGW